MWIKITYSYSGSTAWPFWAEAVVDGEEFKCCGDSFEDAKQRVIEQINQAVNRPLSPRPEYVEIDLGGGE